MNTSFVILALCLSAVAAIPAPSERIVGGSATTIGSYPSMASVMELIWFTWTHKCGGTILSNRAVITAAHCVMDDRATEVRFRIGSTSSTSGGTIHLVDRIILNPSFVRSTRDSDAAILRSSEAIQLGSLRAAPYASSHYDLPDNSVVWAAGWGATSSGGANVATLRHVELRTINDVTCVLQYAEIRFVTANMLCSGWPTAGGRDQCNGDSGGPLFHNGILVGISSWGLGCGDRNFPGVNARVSRFNAWIGNNI